MTANRVASYTVRSKDVFSSLRLSATCPGATSSSGARYLMPPMGSTSLSACRGVRSPTERRRTFSAVSGKNRPQEVVFYNPRLYVRHLQRPEKITLRWHLSQTVSAGRSSQAVFGQPYGRMKRYLMLVKAATPSTAFSFEVARGVLWRDRARYPFPQNY